MSFITLRISIGVVFSGVLLTIIVVKAEDVVYNQSKGNLDFETLQEGAGFLTYLKQLV